MADIRVERTHGLGKAAAMQAALRVAERIKEKAHAEYRVVGDSIEISRAGASGRIAVAETSVVAEVTLGVLLKPMRSVVEQKIDEYFARYFG